MDKRTLLQADPVTRRAFMSHAATAFLGVTALPAGHLLSSAQAAAKGGTAKHVIYVYLSGGMSHKDTFDTRPGTEQQGPVRSLKTSADGIQVGEYFPNLAKQMDKVAVIRSMTSTQGAHERANYLMHTSYTMRGTIQHPGMGTWAMKLKPGPKRQTLPEYVLVGGVSKHPGAGFFETRYAPLPIGNAKAGLQNSKMARGVSEKQFNARLKLADSFDRGFRRRYDTKQVRAYTDLYADAVKLMRSEDLAAFDILKEPDAVQNRYGANSFGQGCLLARRLVENGVRFVEVYDNGWDTHNDNFERLGDKTPPVDQGLAALFADLDAKGLLKSTLVVLATDFGRTPDVNDRAGRDHYPAAFSCLLAGGGVKGGQAYGKTDQHAAKILENPVQVADFNATIAYAMGLPLEKVLHSPSGRPFKVADKGKPITAIF